MDASLFKLKAVLLEALVSQAESSMLFPKSDPFEHGVQVGVYRGILNAVAALDAIDKDAEEEDKRR